ncbi:MAG TPA: hypothetical protein VK982_11110, partial [Bacteroidales bacterium]|nr:hypothetical protein [Bacteroidales bacterium]
GKIDKGKLTVFGKADEFYTNENGLLIQSNLIVSIALNNYYIKDAIVINSKSGLILLVELKLSVLLYKEKPMNQIEDMLNVKLLEKINKTVDRYSTINRIIVIPNGFVRKEGKIKISSYILNALPENIN